MTNAAEQRCRRHGQREFTESDGVIRCYYCRVPLPDVERVCGYHDVVCVSTMKPCRIHGDGKPRSGGRHG